MTVPAEQFAGEEEPYPDYVPENLGRIARRAFSGDYQVHGDPDQADSVIGLSFSVTRSDDGNLVCAPVNLNLVGFILNNFPDLPMALEHPMNETYGNLSGDGASVIRVAEEDIPEAYRRWTAVPRYRKRHELDSRKVILTARDKLAEHGLRKPVLVAKPHQMPRADAIAQRYGIDTIAPAGLAVAAGFDGNVTYNWTRSLEDWRSYERKGLIYHKLRGWI